MKRIQTSKYFIYKIGCIILSETIETQNTGFSENFVLQAKNYCRKGRLNIKRRETRSFI